INPDNWVPFIPESQPSLVAGGFPRFGFSGIITGAGIIFFAYIGFDALSTTAEECKNPQRDLPRAMVYSIIICTVLYIIIALVLTGMVNYTELDVDDPLAYVFEKINLKWFSGIIAVSAVVAMAGVFLVFQLGQPRIWMTMSRDGLLPKRFSYIHPKYRTPTFATIITGFFVVIPMLFIPSDTVLDLCSMGTLFAFVLVCGGVLKLQVQPDAPRGKFRTPYVNAKWIFPLFLVAASAFLFTKYEEDTVAWLGNKKEMFAPTDLLHHIPEAQIPAIQQLLTERDSAGMAAAAGVITTYFESLKSDSYKQVVEALPVDDTAKYESGWALFQHKIPMWLFIFTCLALAWLAFKHNLSLIPILGLVSCFYMMAQIPARSWAGFFIWLAAGLAIYFSYGYANSKLATGKN
ncbi:MAG: amino acid permease, partial [Saprospiraceae bacterium]|nr:amino acid permease [Saprospiraceae bacterium]